MSKSIEKLKALKLRRNGNTINYIASKLGVSKGSVSLWCQEIILTSAQQEKIKKNHIADGTIGRLKGALANKQKRLNAIEMANKESELEIKSLTKRDLMMLGIGLYWGEGIKSRSGQTAIINSDVEILKIAKKWFLDCMNVQSKELRPYIYIALQHKNRETIIMDYWAKTLSLPKSQFKSPIYIPQKPQKRYENHDSYFGVVALRVVKSTNLKYRIQGLIGASIRGLE